MTNEINAAGFVKGLDDFICSHRDKEKVSGFPDADCKLITIGVRKELPHL